MIITILFFIILYSFVAGGTGKQLNALGQSKCNHKVHDWEKCGHYYSGIIGGMFWPVALPIAAGMKSSEAVPTPVSKEVKVQKQREAELESIRHEAQVEQQLLMKDEMLSRRLALTLQGAEQEKKLLELEASGVNVDKIRRQSEDAF